MTPRSKTRGFTLTELMVAVTGGLFISLAVFVPFVLLYMRQPLKLDYFWASLCMLGAVYFMFRK